MSWARIGAQSLFSSLVQEAGNSCKGKSILVIDLPSLCFMCNGPLPERRYCFQWHILVNQEVLRPIDEHDPAQSQDPDWKSLFQWIILRSWGCLPWQWLQATRFQQQTLMVRVFPQGHQSSRRDPAETFGQLCHFFSEELSNDVLPQRKGKRLASLHPHGSPLKILRVHL